MQHVQCDSVQLDQSYELWLMDSIWNGLILSRTERNQLPVNCLEC